MCSICYFNMLLPTCYSVWIPRIYRMTTQRLRWENKKSCISLHDITCADSGHLIGWASCDWPILSFFFFAVLIWVENSKMAKSSCVAAVRMDAWPMIGVIWPWRCCRKMKARGKWQLFVVCIYSGMKIGPTFNLGQAYRSGISILALFISPLVYIDWCSCNNRWTTNI